MDRTLWLQTFLPVIYIFIHVCFISDTIDFKFTEFYSCFSLFWCWISLGLSASPAQCRCSVCFYPNVTCHQAPCSPKYSPCALFNGTTIIEQPVDLLTLDEKYVMQSRHFIRTNVETGTPFFLYYASHHTHHPQYAGKETSGTSIRGRFGDSLAALDWEVGQIYEELKENGILEDTFFLFSADNG